MKGPVTEALQRVMGSRYLAVGMAATLLALPPACGDDADAGNTSVDARVSPDASVDAATISIPPCDETITALMATATAAAPGADSAAYAPPTDDHRHHLGAALQSLLGGDDGAALTAAMAAEYDVCREGDTVLLRPVAANGRAWIALRIGTSRPIVVGIPHPNFELRTLDQGIQAWSAWGARALVVAGTHRCANPTASGCTGTTGVCSLTTAPFRQSDMAHTETSQFQAAHEALLTAEPDLVVLSLHGMSGSGISLSNGTTAAVTSSSLLARAAQALAVALPTENITACSAGAGVPEDARLCGTTNTQGRLVNGADPPCTQTASAAAGRFLHLEQSLSVRQEGAAVLNALEPLLP